MGRPPIGKHAMSGAERQRRYLDRLLERGPSATEPDHALIQQQLTTTQLELEKAQARIAELEKQVQAAPPMSSHKDARDAELELGVISLRRALKQAQAQAAASAKPKPPVDPNTEVARLKKTIQTLRGKIADLMRWHDEQMRKSGKMRLPTFRAVIKCLHADRTPSIEERELACRLFNDFIEDHRGKGTRS